MPQIFKTKVSKIEDLSPRVKRFVLDLDKSLTFTPGQFATWMVNVDGKRESKPYSFASSKWNDVSQVEFFILLEPSGKVTPHLFEMQSGEEISIVAPAGYMVLPSIDKYEEVIFLATGTGVGPFVPMIEQCLSLSKKTSLIFGCYNEDEILVQEHFKSLISSIFSYTPVLSHPRGSWNGETGFVQDQLENRDYSNCLFVICGNPQMLQSALEKLDKLEVPKDNIIYEEWMQR